jgi:hypothetical protein
VELPLRFLRRVRLTSGYPSNTAHRSIATEVGGVRRYDVPVLCGVGVALVYIRNRCEKHGSDVFFDARHRLQSSRSEGFSERVLDLGRTVAFPAMGSIPIWLLSELIISPSVCQSSVLIAGPKLNLDDVAS